MQDLLRQQAVSETFKAAGAATESYAAKFAKVVTTGETPHVLLEIATVGIGVHENKGP